MERPFRKDDSPIPFLGVSLDKPKKKIVIDLASSGDSTDDSDEESFDLSEEEEEESEEEDSKKNPRVGREILPEIFQPVSKFSDLFAGEEKPYLICGFDLGTRQAGFTWLDAKRLVCFTEQIDFHIIDGFEYKLTPELMSYQARAYGIKWKDRFDKTYRIAPEVLHNIPGANKKVRLFGYFFMHTISCLYAHIQIHWVDPKRVNTAYGISGGSYDMNKMLAAYKVCECMEKSKFERLQAIYKGCVDVYDAILLACYSYTHYDKDRDCQKLECKGVTTKPRAIASGLLKLTQLPRKGRPSMDFTLPTKQKIRGSTIRDPFVVPFSVVEAKAVGTWTQSAPLRSSSSSSSSLASSKKKKTSKASTKAAKSVFAPHFSKKRKSSASSVSTKRPRHG